jgi:hypothetical protein
MAKRTRYPGRSSSRRPGANRLVRRDPPKAKPAVVEPIQPAPSIAPEIITDDGLGTETGAPLTARGAGLSQAEIDRAAQLEAEMTARERALEAVRRRAPGAAAAAGRAHVDVNQPLSIRASHEYDYVARDVRRIILTGSLMVAILAVLDILVNVMGVVQL